MIWGVSPTSIGSYRRCLILWSSDPLRLSSWGSLRRLLDRQCLFSCRGPDLPRRRRTWARSNGHGSVLALSNVWKQFLSSVILYISLHIEFTRGYSTQCPLKCHNLQDCTSISYVDIIKIEQQQKERTGPIPWTLFYLQGTVKHQTAHSHLRNCNKQIQHDIQHDTNRIKPHSFADWQCWPWYLPPTWQETSAISRNAARCKASHNIGVAR